MGGLTHRRSDKVPIGSTGHVLLFAEEGNEHYGRNVWVLQTDLPPVPVAVVRFASDYYAVSMEEAESLVDPSNIVSSAGAWDDGDFVSDLWQAMERGEVPESPGFRTQEGAVLLDPTVVSLSYYRDDW